MEKPKRMHIYYDDGCPMCTAFAQVIVKSNTTQTVVKVSSSEYSTSIPKTELLREIHLVEEDGTIRKGADAVLTSFTQIYPWLTPLKHAVRMPVINQLVNLMYLFISKKRTLWYGGDNSRVYWLFIITTLGLLSGLIFSWPAWREIRNYPTLPIFETISIIEPFTNALSFIVVILLSVALFTYKNSKWFCLSILIILGLLVSLDISRLQPWVLHYSALLLLLSFWNPQSKTLNIKILDAARIIIVSIYFWSGLQKLNTAFFIEVFPWFTESLWSPFGEIGAIAILNFGILVPFIEMGFAVGLLTKKYRKISIICSGLMLLLVTVCLMLGHGWNSVVWPWNFAIFSMVAILFLRYNDSFEDFIKRSYKNFLAVIIFILFTLLPIGSIFNKVDHYLSWSLYSGHITTAHLNATEDVFREVTGTDSTDEDADIKLDFTKWSMDEINLVPYPEERVFVGIFKKICESHNNDESLTLSIETRPFFYSHNVTMQKYTCSSPSITLKK